MGVLNRVLCIRKWFLLFFFLAATTISQLGVSHSAMMPDGFVFDNTNENRDQTSQLYSKISASQLEAECIDGRAAGFPCKNIDLLSTMQPTDLGSGNARLNDIWGWTDPVTGKEIAIVGRTNGTSFVDVSNPSAPVFLGFLPTSRGQTGAWRDIKVYQDHAFIVADSNTSSTHGMQIYELRELFAAIPGSTLTETTHYGGFGAAHNIAINEESGFAYAIGSDQCSGGLYMMDISSPASPAFVGCFSSDGYTHDAQCVNYNGPDSRFTGAEICVAYNEDTVTIVDVSNKASPVLLSRTSYPGVGYTHQGWFFNDEHKQIVFNDELDEMNAGGNTTSIILDVSLLDNPTIAGRYIGPTTAIDHNLYSKSNLVFETNYRAGLRVLGSVDINRGCLEEVAYFDTIPNSDSAQFSGTWSSYIYFASANVIISDIEAGLFVVKPDQTSIDAEVAVLPNNISQCSDPGNNNDDPPPGPGTPEDIIGGGGGGAIQQLLVLIMGLAVLASRRFKIAVR